MEQKRGEHRAAHVPRGMVSWRRRRSQGAPPPRHRHHAPCWAPASAQRNSVKGGPRRETRPASNACSTQPAPSPDLALGQLGAQRLGVLRVDEAAHQRLQAHDTLRERTRDGKHAVIDVGHLLKVEHNLQ